MINMINAGRSAWIVASLALLVFIPFRSSQAQLHPPNSMGVTMGQLHYHVRDIEADKKFWITLGGTPAKKLSDMEVVKFPGVVILLSHGDPSGGTDGSVISHVGFRVPSAAKTFERMKNAGYKIAPNENGVTGDVYDPDGDRIEILQALSPNVKYDLDSGRKDFEAERNNRALTTTIELHHIHFYVPEKSVADVKTWYVKMFGAVPGHRFHYEAADLPGVELDILGVPAALLPTKGRTLDHIGFEVKDLREFCKKLEVSGVKFTSPYTEHSFGVATAAFTDPWGVSIELSEGLDRL